MFKMDQFIDDKAITEENSKRLKEKEQTVKMLFKKFHKRLNDYDIDNRIDGDNKVIIKCKKSVTVERVRSILDGLDLPELNKNLIILIHNDEIIVKIKEGLKIGE